jgi:hypothetical protein
MRLSAILIAAAAMVAAIVPPTVPARAAPPPRVQGYNCSALAPSVGPSKVWRTSFRGEKRDIWDHYWPYSASPCFPSLSACKAWLYWAQSDYPDRNTFTPCKRLGY